MFNFWFIYIKPSIKSNPDLSTTLCLFLSFLFSKRPLLIISDHVNLQDYFLLNEKPYFRNIFIECGKAAAIESPDKSIRILFEGFHRLNRAEFILAIFPLGLHSFIIGDKNEEYPFFCYEKNENIPFIKTHHLDLQKSRSITQDKYEIYPSFLITYQLGNVLTKETTTINIISSLSKFMQKNQRSGEVQ